MVTIWFCCQTALDAVVDLLNLFREVPVALYSCHVYIHKYDSFTPEGISPWCDIGR